MEQLRAGCQQNGLKSDVAESENSSCHTNRPDCGMLRQSNLASVFRCHCLSKLVMTSTTELRCKCNLRITPTCLLECCHQKTTLHNRSLDKQLCSRTFPFQVPTLQSTYPSCRSLQHVFNNSWLGTGVNGCCKGMQLNATAINHTCRRLPSTNTNRHGRQMTASLPN